MADYGTLRPCIAALCVGQPSLPWQGRWWRPRTATVHLWAVRLCALVYFFAFLGIVLDGPLMWALMPPEGGLTAEQRVQYSRIGIAFALVALVLPRLWPALAICWPCWHFSHTNGGMWFGFGWDPMLDDVGFLSLLLSITLTLYDDLVEEQAFEELLQLRKADSAVLGRDPKRSTDEGSLKPLLGQVYTDKQDKQWQSCVFSAGWSVLAAELAQTISAFRLFSIAGILKKKQGSECWRDYTCLYTHFYTQPMPNPLAWYFHNWTSPSMKQFMQWFAIDIGECLAPFLLLGFLLSTGPVGMLHKSARRNSSAALQWLTCFPARLIGSLLMAALLLGMFVSGNYAFLHPLSLVCLIASCGTARCVPMTRGDSSSFATWYRFVMSWFVIVLAVFAILPSCNTLQWLLRAEADSIGSGWWWSFRPVYGWMNSQGFVQSARDMNLGMDHYRYAYFAGAVESREEYVYTVQVGSEWIEFDVPCKVGSVDRAPCITSPLHRRFAWQLWFPFGEQMFNYNSFFDMICRKDDLVFRALEMRDVREKLQQYNLTAVAKQAFSYHFSENGEIRWWTRKPIREREVHNCA